MSEVIAKLLRRDRLLVAGSLLLVSAICWAYLFAGAGMGMSGIEMTRHSMMSMNMPAPSWSLPYALVMFLMWWIMMIAMMLPSATPVILLSSALNRVSQPGREPFGNALSFACGYLAAWGLFSAIMVAMQWALTSAELMSGLVQSNSTALNGVLLLLAGAWQFTPWKQACLQHCRGPIEFLTRRRHQGNTGAFLTGGSHGVYCLGCCWFLMVLLFIGGVMNLLWIAGLAIYVWVEKMLPGGEWISRVMGVLLIAWAATLLVFS